VTGAELRGTLAGVQRSVDADGRTVAELASALDGQDLAVPLREAARELEDALSAVGWALELAGRRSETATVPVKGRAP
jgi:hypothetical protein